MNSLTKLTNILAISLANLACSNQDYTPVRLEGLQGKILRVEYTEFSNNEGLTDLVIEPLPTKRDTTNYPLIHVVVKNGAKSSNKSHKEEELGNLLSNLDGKEALAVHPCDCKYLPKSIKECKDLMWDAEYTRFLKKNSIN